MIDDKMPYRRRGLAAALAIVVVLGAAVAVIGCGDEPESERAFALAIRDRSTSFSSFSAECVPDFMRVAVAVAERSGDLYGGALLGNDPFGTRLRVEAHFNGSVPAAIRGNGELERAYRRRQASALRPDFEALVREPVSGGSPVLRTLDRAANFVAQRAGSNRPIWIVVCTDLANVGGGLDVRRPITDTMVRRAVDQWTPRLRALRGAELYFIGVGRRAADADSLPDSIRQVQRVISGVAARIGARVQLMDTQLGERFPLVV